MIGMRNQPGDGNQIHLITGYDTGNNSYIVLMMLEVINNTQIKLHGGSSHAIDSSVSGYPQTRTLTRLYGVL